MEKFKDFPFASALILFAALAVSLRAEAPGVINYQGKLADSSGNPLTGTYSLTFKIYAAPTGGAALFTETRTADVPVDNGVFNVHIGSSTGGGIPLSVFQGGTDRYLGVTVGADAEMTPRERLSASPYALAVASASVGTAELADGTVAVGDLNTASVDGRYVTLSTIQTITSSKTFSGGATVTGLPTPTGAADAAPKSYVDSQVTGGSGWTDVGAVVRLTTAGDTIGASGGTAAGVTFSTNVFLSAGRLGIGAAAAGESLDVNGLIKILKAGGVDNDSPGIVAVSDDDFLYDGEYINHYGIGFHDFNDGAGLGVNAYMAGYFGVDLFTGGQPRLRINSNGNVGIGSAGPGAKLDVAGDIRATSDIGNLGTGSGQKMEAGTSALATLRFDADAYRLFAGGTGASGEVLRVTETGSVGLSTGAPGALLDVQGNAQFGSSAKSTFTSAGILQLASVLESVYGGTGADLSGGVLGGVPYFSGAGVMSALGAGTAGQFLKSNGSAAPAWASVTASDVSDTMTLSTNQSASGVKTFTSSVTITADQFSVGESTLVVLGGKVGIGTSNPSSKLHLADTGSVEILLEADTDNATENDLPTIDFRTDGGTSRMTIGVEGNAGGKFTGALGNAPYIEAKTVGFQIATNDNARMTFDTAGNVGIGTTAPATKLHMSSGVFTIDGTSPGIAVGVSTFVVIGGQVGIGSASPSALLDVNGVIKATGTVFNALNYVWPSAHGSNLYLKNDGSGNLSWAAASGSVDTAANYNWTGTHTWQSSATFVNGAFSIGGSTFVVTQGKVGIGTASPGARLNVVGPADGEDVAYFKAGTNTVGIKPGANAGTENMILTLGSNEGTSQNLGIYGFGLGQFPRFKVEAADVVIVATMSASGTELVLQQVNDTYGPTRLRLQNRNGVNGAVFEQAGSVDLIDFVFKGLNNQRNIRYENRSGATYTGGTPEFQIGDPVDPTLVIADTTTVVRRGNLGIGTAAPATTLEVSGVAHIHDNGTPADNQYAGALRVTRGGTSGQYINMVRAGNTVWSLGTVYNSNTFGLGLGVTTDSSFTSPVFSITDTEKVGIGTTSPATKLDVNGDLAFRANTLGALANGNNNDLAIGAFSFIRVASHNAGSTITGIAGGQNGKMVVIYNTVNNLTIANASASSAAANRIRTMSGANLVTTGEGTITLIYDSTLSNWLVTGFQS
jgi:hypothetical protein